MLVRSRDELAETVAKAPGDHGSTALRSEVIFVKRPLTTTRLLGLLDKS